MKRLLVVALLGFLISSTVFAQARRRTVTPPANDPPTQAGDPLPRLNATLLAAFTAGGREFGARKNVNDGLGPVFNDVSCAACHNQPVPGGGSGRTVTRIGTVTDGVYDPLTTLGGSLLQDRAIGPQQGSTHPFRPEVVPPSATIVARRRSTPLFGLGLLDATPDATFIALAAQQAASGDGTAGKVSFVDNPAAGTRTVGKFGWKAQVPTLFRFAGDASLNEMGITNPQFASEVCPSGNCAELQFNPRPGLNDGGEDIQALTDFMTYLAAPSRGVITTDASEGERVFERIGCNSCHVATLQTAANTIAALNRVTYHPYSDFLLHDMGALGDGVVQDTAGAREMRTSPLWGLRMINRYLHDGRAMTLEGAISAHDGQSAAARTRFNALDAADRARLLAFLRSL